MGGPQPKTRVLMRIQMSNTSRTHECEDNEWEKGVKEEAEMKIYVNSEGKEKKRRVHGEQGKVALREAIEHLLCWELDRSRCCLCLLPNQTKARKHSKAIHISEKVGKQEGITRVNLVSWINRAIDRSRPTKCPAWVDRSYLQCLTYCSGRSRCENRRCASRNACE